MPKQVPFESTSPELNSFLYSYLFASWMLWPINHPRLNIILQIILRIKAVIWYSPTNIVALVGNRLHFNCFQVVRILIMWIQLTEKMPKANRVYLRRLRRDRLNKCELSNLHAYIIFISHFQTPKKLKNFKAKIIRLSYSNSQSKLKGNKHK